MNQNYVEAITELLRETTDTKLLDLILQLLQKARKSE